ncbi:MAG: hypothetical protein R8L53_10345 [Mariprofundales bacterium]
MSIQSMSKIEFRRELAKHENKKIMVSEEDNDKLKNLCVEFLSLLPNFYGDNLDRKLMWRRIANGIPVASTKANGEFDMFVNEMLVYINASPERVASHEQYVKFIADFVALAKGNREIELVFINLINSRIMVLIPFARQVWTAGKGAK